MGVQGCRIQGLERLGALAISGTRVQGKGCRVVQ